MKSAKTITDIAKECGVSISTVSRVINNNPHVTEDTKRRVEEVIKKYNYSPNALARGLIYKQSMTIGMIVPDISNPYFYTIFNEIERAAHEANYSVFLCNTLFSASAHAKRNLHNEETYFQMMIDKKVDGVLVAGGQLDLLNLSPSYLDALKHLSQSLPLVIIGKPIKGIDCFYLNRDDNSGIATALKYLASLGHKNIAFIGGEDGVVITQERIQMFKDTLVELGLPFQPELIELSDYYTPDGYSATMNLLNKNIPFSAALTANDNVAIGALRAFADQGIKVPDDISLISCDQFHSADYLTPRLTSIDRHTDLFGKYIIQVLLSIINGSTDTPVLNIPYDLVKRESCIPYSEKQNTI